MTASEIFNSKMQAMKQNFLDKMRDQLKTLDGFRKQLLEGSLDEGDRKALMDLAHDLAGSGGTFGFMKITNSSRQLEDALRKKAPSCSDDALLTYTQELMEVCELSLKGDEPITAPAPAETDVAIPAVSLQFKDKKRLLVVEDNQATRQLLRELFRAYADVTLAADTTLALGYLQQEHFDLVLLDDQLANGTSGSLLLNLLREKPELNNIPVIMITGNTSPESIKAAYEAGAIDYVTKPFNATILSRKVLRHLIELSQ